MNIPRRSTLALGLSLQLFTGSCGPLSTHIEPGKQSTGTSENSQQFSLPSSFVVASQGEGNGSQTANYRIAIKRSSLNKEFLLRANVVKGAPSATFSNLKSRIVVFTQVGDKLYLIESSAGHTVQKDLTQVLILAEMPVVSEEQDLIYFDFNRGMNKLYTQQDWYAQDLSGSEHPGEDVQFGALTLDVRYLKKAELLNPDALQVVQAAQVRQENAIVPIEVYYHLAPYAPTQDFSPTLSPDKTQFGFFEVNPEIDSSSGKAKIHATKFDARKPIVFAISANTPQEFRDTVKEGILYWNKAFGREVVQAIDAPAGVTAPSYQYNMVQWIDWQDAGFAYADAQMDPRTGEVLNAQIYLTSAFTSLAKSKVHGILRRLVPLDTQPIESTAKINTLLSNAIAQHQKGSSLALKLADLHLDHGGHKHTTKNFVASPLCNHEAHQSVLMGLAQIVEQGLSEEAITEVVKDYLRQTVAHEIGHTLGLRHNFAGHHEKSYQLEEKKGIFSSYLNEHALPENLQIASTVMDYLPFDDAAMLGRQIKDSDKALSYDANAIAVLYNDKPLQELGKLPHYCTDSHVGAYVDCRRFAPTASPFASARYEGERVFKQLPHFLLDYFLAYAKAPAPGVKPQPFDQVRLSSLHLAALLLGSREPALAAIGRDSQAVTIDRRYDHTSETNAGERAIYYAIWLMEDLSKAGGWDKVMEHVGETFAANLSKDFAAVLDQHVSGSTAFGSYNFTPDEVAAMKKAVENYAPLLERALQVVDILQLAQVKNLSETPISLKGDTFGDLYGAYLGKKVAVTNLQRSKEKIKSSYKLNVQVELVGAKRIALFNALKEAKPQMLTLTYGDPNDTSTLSPAEIPVKVLAQLNELLDKIAVTLDVEPLIKLFGLDKDPAAMDTIKSEVTVPVLIPVQLSSFANSYLIRAVSVLLLKERITSDLSFGSTYRFEIGSLLSKLYSQDLRGLNLQKLPHEGQAKQTNAWLQENKLILQLLGDTPVQVTKL